MNREELLNQLLEKSAVAPIYVSEISRVYPQGSSEYEFISSSLDARDVEIIDDTIEAPEKFDLETDVDTSKIDLTNIPFKGDLVELYLKDIAAYPILSAEEELELFKIYEKGVAAEAKLADFIVGNIELSDEERALLKEDAIAAENARAKIINCNLRLVVYNAKNYNNRGLSFMDLIQEGSMGLIVAINKFDYRLGYKFSTYATNWIRQAISRSLDLTSRTIRIPSHVIEKNNKILEAERRLSAELGRDATIEEISKEVNISPEKIRAIKQAFIKPTSLENKVGTDEDSTLGDFVKDTQSQNPYEYTKNKNLKETLDKILGVLNEREAGVLILRYGLDGNKPLTLEEVGLRYNLTRERIRQIESRVLKKLRDPKIMEMLRDFKENE